MLNLGIDVGSSSVKVAIYDHQRGTTIGTAQHPEQEMEMIAQHPGWAEQHPDWWWNAFKMAFQKAIKQSTASPQHITNIGISYQMHGLVCLDKAGEPLRPSIIWCDSRAVPFGQKALEALGDTYAFDHLLNSPGNFTAAKLAWVKENEPDLFDKIDKICLPGDFIAFRLTGELTTTISGLSEGIFYDFKEKSLSTPLLEYFGFSECIIPTIKNSFDDHGTVRPGIAQELGISPNARVMYKAGDQPNNAFSLNVLNPGEIAATAGTSGVIYGVSDELFIDHSQRVNSFAHVNYTKIQPRIGILLCVNGTGIANSWAHKWTHAESYASMNEAASAVPVGSEGLTFFPFGNGAERMLGNGNLGSSLHGLNFNTHQTGHLYRAVQEGITYALLLGMEAFTENNINLKVIRAGHANMFLSPLFGQILSTLSGVPIELFDTDGATGAARGAAVGAKNVSIDEVFNGLERLHTFEPDLKQVNLYQSSYQGWKNQLSELIK